MNTFNKIKISSSMDNNYNINIGNNNNISINNDNTREKRLNSPEGKNDKCPFTVIKIKFLFFSSPINFLN
jgi:hypothetical protein